MTWTWDGRSAQMSAADCGWGCRWEPENPTRGLQDLQISDVQISLLVPLGLRFDPRPNDYRIAEAYTRDRDFVVTYQPDVGLPFYRRICWRQLSGPEPGTKGLEVSYFANTDLLNSHPRLIAWTESHQDRVMLIRDDGGTWSTADGLTDGMATSAEVGLGIVLVREVVPGVSYLEMVLPADCDQIQVTSRPPHRRFEYHLCAEFLEKGVIRVGRVRCFFVPSGSDERWAERFYREFVASPHPLTA